MTPRDELDRRLLAEARARDNGRVFRRALFLVLFAVGFLAYGSQKPNDLPLAVIVAVVLVVVAGVVVWRGERA